MLKAACVALVVAVPASAEVEFTYDEVLTTRFGELHVEGSDFVLTLWRDTEPLPLPEDGRWWIDWSKAGEGDYDWVIASHHHGGNSCGGASYILRVSADETAISRPLDGCNGAITDIRTGSDWIELDRTDQDITVTHVTARWQGDAYTETYHYAPPAEPAGAGEDVTRWIAASPYEIFQDARERARFGQVMEAWSVQRLSDFTLVSTSVMREGDWVYATGCQPHSCGLVMGAFGLRVSDGAVAAVLFDGTEQRFGLADDPAFQAAIAEGMQ